MNHENYGKSFPTHTPEWVKHSVFYQIFPDRFARNLSKMDSPYRPANLEAWNALPTHHGFKGGNLWGVIDRLDYLSYLGISAIYLNPIFQSPSNHRYATHDYYQVDPLLGGNIAFRELLKAAHASGIKIVLDGVFNHSGRGFYYFNNILENGSDSPWVDWYTINDWPLVPYLTPENDASSYPANYVCWENQRDLPQFNHNNPAVREYLMRVGEYWIREGVDGWRIDAPHYIRVATFWEEFRSRIKATNPQSYILGEAFFPRSDGTSITRFFDGITNYRLRSLIIAFVYGERINSEHLTKWVESGYTQIDSGQFASSFQHLLESAPWEIQLSNLNFLSNHDTARLISLTNGDTDGLRLAIMLLFTLPGIPCIYYGEEIAMHGGIDPDCRRCFPWQNEWDHDILENYRSLIAIRNNVSALHVGKYYALHAQGNSFVFLRVLEKEIVVVAINIGMTSSEIMITKDKLQEILDYDTCSDRWTTLYRHGKLTCVEVEGSRAYKISLTPRSGTLILVSP